LQRLPQCTSSLHYAYIASLVHLGVERNRISRSEE
jgi:hypothetical protein